MPPRDKTSTEGTPDPAGSTAEQPDPAGDGPGATEEQKPAEAGATVRLAVLAGPASPDSLVVGDGDTALEITADGTDVPTDREDEVRAAARQHGVTIRKVN